jgi:hypothetical protein
MGNCGYPDVVLALLFIYFYASKLRATIAPVIAFKLQQKLLNIIMIQVIRSYNHLYEESIYADEGSRSCAGGPPALPL